jgi:hypothetical protein
MDADNVLLQDRSAEVRANKHTVRCSRTAQSAAGRTTKSPGDFCIRARSSRGEKTVVSVDMGSFYVLRRFDTLPTESGEITALYPLFIVIPYAVQLTNANSFVCISISVLLPLTFYFLPSKTASKLSSMLCQFFNVAKITSLPRRTRRDSPYSGIYPPRQIARRQRTVT